MTRIRLASIGLLVSAGPLLSVATVRADIVAIGGSVVIADPPANIQQGNWESDTETRVWMEQHLTLPVDLPVDAVNTGTFRDGTENIPGSIAALSTVTSYMLRIDPVASNSVILTGFVVFDEPIVGASFLRGTLNSTDAIVGRPGVTYNTNSLRGLELPSNDLLTISEDRLRVDFTFASNGSGTDDVRIITTVPTPGSIMIISGGAFLAFRRWR